MPYFGHIFKELEKHLKEQRRLENDQDYQLALKELEDFLQYKGIKNADRRGLHSV